MAQAIIVRRGGKGSAPSYPYNVSGLSYTNTDASVTVKWTDPADSAWAGTLVLAKQGGYPSGPTDSSAITIVDSKVKNQYGSTGFTKTNLAAGAWYFQAYPYDGDGAVSNNVANRLAVTVTYIYPSALASFSITGGNAQATPVFTLPADAVSVDLVYKTGSYPSSITDGTVIQNATSGVAVTSLTNDVTYYFRAFPKNTYGRYNTATTGNQASVTPQALPAKDTLQNTSWANIALVAAAGKASEYWAVGDQKTVALASTVLGSTSIVVEILGFNHDNLTAGGKAAITFGMVDCFTTTQAMNSTNTNAGGWGSCALRTTIRGTVYNGLPADLKAVIKEVNKLTSAGSQSSTINTTADTLFLFSEIEIFGSTTYSFSGEGVQYSRFATAASRIKKVNGSASSWWERPPRSSNSTTFCTVNSSGTANYANASYTYGVALGFCV